MGESWELLAHLREQQSYCSAAFMTFQNIKLEKGLCSGDLIVFQVGVKSFQQVSPSSSQTPKTSSGRGGGKDGGEPLGLPLPPARSAATDREPEPPMLAPGSSSPCAGAGAAEGSVVWPLLAGRQHRASQPRAPPSAGLWGQHEGRPMAGPKGPSEDTHGGPGDRARAAVSAAHPPSPPRGCSRGAFHTLGRPVGRRSCNLKVLGGESRQAFTPPSPSRLPGGRGTLQAPLPPSSPPLLFHRGGWARSLAAPLSSSQRRGGLSQTWGSLFLGGAIQKEAATEEQREATNRHHVKRSSPKRSEVSPSPGARRGPRGRSQRQARSSGRAGTGWGGAGARSSLGP